MRIEPFFHEPTWTVTYVVWDASTGDAVVIDPVLDYDPAASQTNTSTAEIVGAFLRDRGLKLRYVLETHAHADHLSASRWFKRHFDAAVAIGAGIADVQQTFKSVFGLPAEFPTDGRQFDRLLRHGDTLEVGGLTLRVLETPGHTPACVSYLVEDAVFTGDALFMPDFGTGRCDFPLGSADDLYSSVHDTLYSLPDETRVFVGHDYGPGGRDIAWETTIGASKQANIQLRADTSREDYVSFRTTRDAGLAAPKLLLPSVRINIDAGALPEPEDDGKRYLKLPLNLFRPTDDAGSHER